MPMAFNYFLKAFKIRGPYKPTLFGYSLQRKILKPYQDLIKLHLCIKYIHKRASVQQYKNSFLSHSAYNWDIDINLRNILIEAKKNMTAFSTNNLNKSRYKYTLQLNVENIFFPFLIDFQIKRVTITIIFMRLR